MKLNQMYRIPIIIIIGVLSLVLRLGAAEQGIDIIITGTGSGEWPRAIPVLISGFSGEIDTVLKNGSPERHGKGMGSHLKIQQIVWASAKMKRK